MTPVLRIYALVLLLLPLISLLTQPVIHRALKAGIYGWIHHERDQEQYTE